MEYNLSSYITILYKDFLSHTESKLKEFGLTYGQLPFILYIGNHEGCTASEIKTHLHMDWGHSQRSISRLESDGFIKKVKNEEKDRTYHLYLTPLGEEALEASHMVFHSWDNELKSKLEPEEWEEIKTILGKLARRRGERWRNERI